MYKNYRSTALLSLFFITVSCKKSTVIATVISTPENEQNKASFVAKLKSNELVKIACEGTSLTYGQNVPGPDNPINGAGQTRALYQYPETMALVLKKNNYNTCIVNRGFPGDRTTEGLSRWQDSTKADAVILEYGTNDAYNFGGYASGKLSVEQFTDNLDSLVKRRLDQGAYVIISSPPDVVPSDNTLLPYKAAILSVARLYDLPVFDIENDVIQNNNDYFDGVHLSDFAYEKWGALTASYFENLNSN
jgi:lysophospholipase L1-like esterase